MAKMTKKPFDELENGEQFSFSTDKPRSKSKLRFTKLEHPIIFHSSDATRACQINAVSTRGDLWSFGPVDLVWVIRG